MLPEICRRLVWAGLVHLSWWLEPGAPQTLGKLWDWRQGQDVSCPFNFHRFVAFPNHVVRLQPVSVVWPNVKPLQSCVCCRSGGHEVLDQVHIVLKQGQWWGLLWSLSFQLSPGALQWGWEPFLKPAAITANASDRMGTP